MEMLRKTSVLMPGLENNRTEDIDRILSERDALQQRLNAVEEENDRLRSALKFYAEKEHFHFDDPDRWDSVSGEPMNILWHDEEGYVEDGTFARKALENRS